MRSLDHTCRCLLRSLTWKSPQYSHANRFSHSSAFLLHAERLCRRSLLERRARRRTAPGGIWPGGGLTATETLRTIAADPKNLAAEIGFFDVLHASGQNLLHHPHPHFAGPEQVLEYVGRYTHRVARRQIASPNVTTSILIQASNFACLGC